MLTMINKIKDWMSIHFRSPIFYMVKVVHGNQALTMCMVNKSYSNLETVLSTREYQRNDIPIIVKLDDGSSTMLNVAMIKNMHAIPVYDEQEIIDFINSSEYKYGDGLVGLKEEYIQHVK